MKKLVLLLLVVPMVSFGQMSNNDWENLNEKSAVTYLKNQGFIVTVTNNFTTSNSDIVGTLIKGILDDRLIKGNVKKTSKTERMIFFQNGSAVWSIMSEKINMNNPMYVNGGDDYVQNLALKIFRNAVQPFQQMYDDFKKNWTWDEALIDTKNKYNTGLFKIDGYTVEAEASLDIKGKGLEYNTNVMVVAPTKEYLLGNSININQVNNYDIPSMIDAFIIDFKYFASKYVDLSYLDSVKVISKFESLGGTTIALAKGMNDKYRIEILIDPENWAKASKPKRWYILYHELGHDVLNFEHGNGGKMMFNFVDKDYSFTEFFEDKKYMFNAFLEKSGRNTNASSNDYLVDNSTMSVGQYYNRGKKRLDSKDYYAAIADFSRYIESNPRVSIAYYYRALAKDNLEDYNGAIADYTKAIEIDPNYAFAYSNRGIVKERIGDLKGACKDWRKAASLGHSNSAKWVRNQCN